MAALRLAGVIKFIAPRVSYSPQRPQLDSSVIQRSMVAASTAGADCAKVAWAASRAMTQISCRAKWLIAMGLLGYLASAGRDAAPLAVPRSTVLAARNVLTYLHTES